MTSIKRPQTVTEKQWGHRCNVRPECRHILVVDDDACLRSILQKLLENAGYVVTCAEDGEYGRECLCRESFDVLVTDNSMPRLSGVELLRWIRGEGRLLPVLLISGNIPWEEPDLLELLLPGEILQKPFACAELLDAVETVWASSLILSSGGKQSCDPERQSFL